MSSPPFVGAKFKLNVRLELLSHEDMDTTKRSPRTMFLSHMHQFSKYAHVFDFGVFVKNLFCVVPIEHVRMLGAVFRVAPGPGFSAGLASGRAGPMSPGS